MKLYYAPGACSFADHAALAASGLKYELVKVDLKAKTTDTGASYTKVNPKGYVPALELDDGSVLTENIAILSYIAEKSGTLMAKEGLARFRALEMLAYISTEIHKRFSPLFNPRLPEAEKAEIHTLIAKRFALLEEEIIGRTYILGDTLSVADCYLFTMLRWAKAMGVAVPPRLGAYYDQVLALPAFQKAIAEEGLS